MMFHCDVHDRMEDGDFMGCVDLGDGRQVCNEGATEAQYMGTDAKLTGEQRAFTPQVSGSSPDASTPRVVDRREM